jgi:hypothetical protein
VLNKASLEAGTDCQEQLLPSRRVTDMISDSLFDKDWQKQRLMATAMQHYVEQNVRA